jgi:hypothetical protein
MTTKSIFEVIDRNTGKSVIRREPIPCVDWLYLAACMVIHANGIAPVPTDGGRRYTVESEDQTIHIYRIDT